MKKLLTFGVSVVLLFSFAVISLGATIIGGELDFGYDFERSLNYGFAKLITDHRLNDALNAHIAFKYDTIEKYGCCQEAWAELNERFGTIRVGYWEFDVKGDVRVLTPITIIGRVETARAEIKNNCQVRVDLPVKESFSLMGFTTQETAKEEFLYAGGISYKADTWGAEAIYIKYDSTDNADPAAVLNAYWLPFDSTKIYLHYGTSKDRYSKTDGQPVGSAPLKERNSAIIGIYYNSTDFPIYFRYETDLYKGLYDDGASPWGVVLGYKLRNGAMLQYDRYVHPYKTDYVTNDTDIIKFIVCF